MTATTVHSADGTEPILVNDEVFERDIILDLLGTTDGGVTSFEVFTDAGDPGLGQRTYWIGVAYVEVAAAVAFEIVSVVHVPGSREATVTWSSSEGTSYSVDASNDMLSWSELNDDVAGAAGDTTSFIEDFGRRTTPPGRSIKALLSYPPEPQLIQLPSRRFGKLYGGGDHDPTELDWLQCIDFADEHSANRSS